MVKKEIIGTRKDEEAKPNEEEIETDISYQNKNESLHNEEEERSSEKPKQIIKETKVNIAVKDEILHHICGPEFENQDHEKKRPVVRKTLENKQYNKNAFVYFGGSNADPADFEDPDSRNAFVRLVFLILSIMLLLTAILVFLIHMYLFDMFTTHGFRLGMSSAVALFLLSYVWACVPPCRQPPFGYFLLIIQLLLTTILLGAITVRYDTVAILIALVCLVVLCLICVGLACTSFDFTSWILYVLVAFIALTLASFAISIVVLVLKIKMTAAMIVITVACLVAQSILFVIELQMVFGGKSVELNENDYPYGAYLLYSSIVNMFLQILRLIGLFDELDF